MRAVNLTLIRRTVRTTIGACALCLSLLICMRYVISWLHPRPVSHGRCSSVTHLRIRIGIGTSLVDTFPHQKHKIQMVSVLSPARDTVRCMSHAAVFFSRIVGFPRLKSNYAFALRAPSMPQDMKPTYRPHRAVSSIRRPWYFIRRQVLRVHHNHSNIPHIGRRPQTSGNLLCRSNLETRNTNASFT